MARLTRLGGERALAAAPLVWVTMEFGRTYVLATFPWVLARVQPGDGIAGRAVREPDGRLRRLRARGRRGRCARDRGGPRIRRRQANIRAFSRRWRSPSRLSRWSGSGAASASAPAALTSAGDAVRVGLLQGNVDQAEKWNDAQAPQILRTYLQMTRDAVAQGAEVVSWPESATPSPYRRRHRLTERVRNAGA